jgi:hypothetical protein
LSVLRRSLVGAREALPVVADPMGEEPNQPPPPVAAPPPMGMRPMTMGQAAADAPAVHMPPPPMGMQPMTAHAVDARAVHLPQDQFHHVSYCIHSNPSWGNQSFRLSSSSR